MTDYQFSTLYSEALSSTDRDAFISDWAMSSLWGDEEGADIPAERIEQVAAIWDVAHLTIRQMRDHTERFCVPKRKEVRKNGTMKKVAPLSLSHVSRIACHE